MLSMATQPWSCRRPTMVVTSGGCCWMRRLLNHLSDFCVLSQLSLCLSLTAWPIFINSHTTGLLKSDRLSRVGSVCVAYCSLRDENWELRSGCGHTTPENRDELKNWMWSEWNWGVQLWRAYSRISRKWALNVWNWGYFRNCGEFVFLETTTLISKNGCGIELKTTGWISIRWFLRLHPLLYLAMWT